MVSFLPRQLKNLLSQNPALSPSLSLSLSLQQQLLLSSPWIRFHTKLKFPYVQIALFHCFNPKIYLGESLFPGKLRCYAQPQSDQSNKQINNNNISRRGRKMLRTAWKGLTQLVFSPKMAFPTNSLLSSSVQGIQRRHSPWVCWLMGNCRKQKIIWNF